MIRTILAAVVVIGVVVPHPPTPTPKRHVTVDRYATPADCRLAQEGFQVLACTVYFEARNQPFIGQVAVAKTVLNRMTTTIYEVVWQPHQYSWTTDRRITDTRIHDRRAWRAAVDAAETAVHLTTSHIRLVGDGCDLNALVSYHERHVHPHWHGVKRACQIGDHIFYAEAK
jgi:spore germination cell wall hydrolase CwlJ-like protein